MSFTDSNRLRARRRAPADPLGARHARRAAPARRARRRSTPCCHRVRPPRRRAGRRDPPGRGGAARRQARRRQDDRLPPVGPVDGAARHRRRVPLLRARRRHPADPAAVVRARRDDRCRVARRVRLCGTTSSRRASATSPPARSRCARRSTPTRCSTRPSAASPPTPTASSSSPGRARTPTSTPSRDITRGFEGQPIALFVDYVQKVPVFPDRSSRGRAGRARHRGPQAAGARPEAGRSSPSPPPTRPASTPAACTCATSGDRRRSPTRPTPSSCSTRSSPWSPGPTSPTPRRGPRSSTARSCSRSRRTATGAPDVNLEFEKDFAHYRFHPRGRWVAERLWTEGSIEL